MDLNDSSDDSITLEQESELLVSERLAALVVGLPGQKEILYGIIDFCRTPQSPTSVDQKTLEMQTVKKSVYSPVVLRKLLEESGALMYLQPAEPQAAEPQLTVPPPAESQEAEACNDDDPDYLTVTIRPEGQWVATDEGLSAIDSADPFAELKQLLVVEANYRDVFLDLLQYCAKESRSQKELDAFVQENPVTHKPRRYGGYFIDRLEAHKAIVWKDNWSTTEIGKEFLARNSYAGAQV